MSSSTLFHQMDFTYNRSYFILEGHLDVNSNVANRFSGLTINQVQSLVFDIDLEGLISKTRLGFGKMIFSFIQKESRKCLELNWKNHLSTPYTPLFIQLEQNKLWYGCRPQLNITIHIYNNELHNQCSQNEACSSVPELKPTNIFSCATTTSTKIGALIHFFYLVAP